MRIRKSYVTRHGKYKLRRRCLACGYKSRKDCCPECGSHRQKYDIGRPIYTVKEYANGTEVTVKTYEWLVK